MTVEIILRLCKMHYSHVEPLRSSYATVLCPSVVCNVCIMAIKRCFLPKNCLKKQLGNGLWGIEWSHDRWRHHVTPKVEVMTPLRLRPSILKQLEMLFTKVQQQQLLLDIVLW